MARATVETMTSLLCFGLGYTARVFAERKRREGWRILGTSRNPAPGGSIELLHFDRDHPVLPDCIKGISHVLVSIPPDDLGDPVVDLAGKVLASSGDLVWVGYLSTTGVYGDRNGGWVDENSKLLPTSERSRRRVAAEQSWLALWREHGVPVHIFRLAGIYGSGRNLLETARKGQAKRIDKAGQVFSRIHVEDIATVLEASIARPNPGRAYNVCDDLASAPAEVVAYACELLGIEAPPLVPFELAELSLMARSFYLDNKRVSNKRLKEELGVTFAFPDYRAGLRSLAAEL